MACSSVSRCFLLISLAAEAFGMAYNTQAQMDWLDAHRKGAADSFTDEVGRYRPERNSDEKPIDCGQYAERSLGIACHGLWNMIRCMGRANPKCLANADKYCYKTDPMTPRLECIKGELLTLGFTIESKHYSPSHMPTASNLPRFDPGDVVEIDPIYPILNGKREAHAGVIRSRDDQNGMITFQDHNWLGNLGTLPVFPCPNPGRFSRQDGR